jgi:hypothetical protein
MGSILKAEKPAAGNGVSDSLIRIEIISHFHRNPGLVSTPAEISDVTGRELQRVERQMNRLVQLNILEENIGNGNPSYHYVPPYSVAAYLSKKSHL